MNNTKIFKTDFGEVHFFTNLEMLYLHLPQTIKAKYIRIELNEDGDGRGVKIVFSQAPIPKANVWTTSIYPEQYWPEQPNKYRITIETHTRETLGPFEGSFINPQL